MKPSARARGAEQTPVPNATTSANARSVVLDQNRAGPWLGRASGGGVTLASAFDERDAGGRAAHVGKEADKADDGLEITQLEDAAAGDKHLVVAPIRGNGPDDPGAVPTVVALLGPFLADHLDEVAFRKEAAQSVFCNHIRGFFYHGLPLGPFSA